MTNLQRSTLVCFLAYFVMSGMMSPLGIISGPMAEYFNKPITEITANFSWLTGGIFVGSLLALVIYEWSRLKYALLGLYALILVSLVSLPFHSNLTIVWSALGLVGTCCGAGLAGAAIAISRSYVGERQASMLIITDGCFSIAGIVVSWLAVQLIVHAMPWHGTYLFVAFITCIIIILTSLSTFPDNQQKDTQAVAELKELWPVGAWICVCVLFIYTLSQYSLLLWLPNYAEVQLGAPREQAGLMISRFWTGMLIAQLFVSWWVLKIGVRRTVLIGAVASALATMPFWSVKQIDGLIIFSFLFGVVNLGLLKVILSLAMQMVKVPPSRLVSTLLLGATTGTSVAPWASSWMVEATSTYTVLIAVSAGYFIVAVLLVLAMRLSPELQATKGSTERETRAAHS